MRRVPRARARRRGSPPGAPPRRMGEVETSYCRDRRLRESSSVVLHGDCGEEREVLSSHDWGFSDGWMPWSSVDCGGLKPPQASTEASVVLENSNGSVCRVLEVSEHNACQKSPCGMNDAPGYIEDGARLLVLENEGKGGCGGVAGVKGEVPLLEFIEVPKIGTEEENYNFPGLLSLRTQGGGISSSSGIDIAGLFGEGRGYNGSGDIIVLASGQVADCPLLDISGDVAKERDGFCCDSNRYRGNLSVRSCENNSCRDDSRLLSLESAKGFLLPENLTCTSHCEVVEEKGCQASSMEREACNSMKCSTSQLVSCSVVEKSTSMLLSHIPNGVVICASKHSATPVVERTDADSTSRTPVCCSSVADSRQQADNGGSKNAKSGPIIVFRRTNPKRAASLKNSQTDGKFFQLTIPSTNSRKSRKPVYTSRSCSSSMMKIFSSKVKKKRSCTLKSPRSSVWGAVGNIMEIFKQNEGLPRNDSDPIQVKNKKSARGRNVVRLRKKHTDQKDGSLHASKCKSAASANSLHLKGPRFQQPFFPDVTDFLAKENCEIDLGISEIDGDVEHKLTQYRHGLFGVQVNLLQQDRPQCDKDLESTLTQETSAENTPSDCPGVSSQMWHGPLVEAIDRHSSDPGTSPDSDVFNPAIDAAVIVKEGTTSTNQGDEMGQNGENLELRAHDSNHVADWQACSIPLSVSLHDAGNHTIFKKENKSVKVYGSICSQRGYFSIKQNIHCSEKQSKAKKASMCSVSEQHVQDGSCRSDSCPRSIRETSSNGLDCREFPLESDMNGVAELEHCQESTNLGAGLENWQLAGTGTGDMQVQVCPTEGSLTSAKGKGCKIPRNVKAGMSKKRSSRPDSAGCWRQNIPGGKTGNVQKSDSKDKSRGDSQAFDANPEASTSLYDSPGVANNSVLTGSTESRSADVVPKELSEGFGRQYTPPQAAWVLCDDCQKWRCISAELADAIDKTNCRWTCKDNKDKAFADCSIPQEKTNAEINAELEISDEEDACTAKVSLKEFEPSSLAVSQKASWKRIKSNLFLHRNRKPQSIDEVMVCNCKHPSDGSLGCGEECFNRMLNIECVKGTCPCDELCSNQQFQKQKYAKFKKINCGKKGDGLQLQEDVAKGQFLIEYVGEVLDLTAYEARQRYYASRGQKHFYFMMLRGGEVIDACAKGNLGRFINHSCDPNCETQKWMVNGEVCIGLFTLRNIKKGEEVTFNYNYERVFGAAAKKCVCGSSQCRGYIGGDPSNTEVIAQDDAHEEYPEQVRVHKDGVGDPDVDDIMFDTGVKIMKNEEICMLVKDGKNEEIPVQMRESLVAPEPKSLLQNEETLSIPSSDVSLLDNMLQISDPRESEDILCKPLPNSQVLENSGHSSSTAQPELTNCKPISDVQPFKISSESLMTNQELRSESKKLVVNPAEDKPITSKLCLHGSRNTGIKAKRLATSLMPHKIKEVLTGTSGGRLEGVEDKLNQLLDAEGGISKHKDATKGYLKLLFVTAAGGSDVRGASQSIRDLSLILDALLKTKSRMVLVDIVNKNGMQMLHNIMKQNQENFNRIPIIRKLFKVLDFLAQKSILTPEHMNKRPPCSGMESFRESVLRLTRHSDMKVHQIARDFRDKWLPRIIRRAELSNRDDRVSKPECASQRSFYIHRHDQGARGSDAIVCVHEEFQVQTSSHGADILGEKTPPNFQSVSSSAPSTDRNLKSGTQVRKRKSRWDQPSDGASSDPQSCSVVDQSLEASSRSMKPSTQVDHTLQFKISKQDGKTCREENSSSDDAVGSKDPTLQCIDDEAPPGFKAPPGFEPHCMDYHHHFPMKSLVGIGEVVMGHLQERYLSHLTMSYGIPVDIMQQMGTPETRGSQSETQWAVAPGMPFHPFPPLPPYPRGNSDPAAGGQTYASDERIHQGGKGEARLVSSSSRSASRERPGDVAAAGARRPYSAERVRWPCSSSGRRFFQPYWRNNRKFHGHWPPWPREKNDHISRGSIRDGVSSLDVRHGRRDADRGFCSSKDNMSYENVGSNLQQQLQHD